MLTRAWSWAQSTERAIPLNYQRHRIVSRNQYSTKFDEGSSVIRGVHGEYRLSTTERTLAQETGASLAYNDLGTQ